LKICVYGAGAIGGYLAVLLERAGANVSVVARGPHLEAIRNHGLALILDGEELVDRFGRPLENRALAIPGGC
jgi:2-dehydropantoate 2-reductase